MSQAATLRALDATILAELIANGLSDAGALYTPPGGGAATACDVLVDRDVKLFADDEAPVATAHVVVTIFHAQVAAPAVGGVVAIGAEALTLESKADGDESRSRWVVRP